MQYNLLISSDLLFPGILLLLLLKHGDICLKKEIKEKQTSNLKPFLIGSFSLESESYNMWYYITIII